MRLLSWIITIPLAVVLIIFALANRSVVTVSLDPLPGHPSLGLPLFVIILASLLLGFIAGSFATWTSCAFKNMLPRARRLSRTEKELARLRDDLVKDGENAASPKE